MMVWILAFLLAIVIAFFLGAPWWLLVIICLVEGIIGLLVIIDDSFRWPGW